MSYDLDQTLPGQAVSPHASIPWFSSDSGLVFERSARFFGEQLTADARAAPVLREGALPQPGRDPDLRHRARRLQLHPALHREPLQRRRSLRRCEPGDARADLALPRQNGQEALRATIGQRYYFEDERVGLTPTSPLRTNGESDLLAR